MLSSFVFRKKTVAVNASRQELAQALREKDALVWVDLEDPDEFESDSLVELFNFHPLAIEDCLNDQSEPKLDDYEEYIFLVVHAVDFKAGEALHNLKDYQQTIKQFKEHIDKYPESNRKGEIYFYLGESYYYLEQSDLAALNYTKAVEFAYDNKTILMSKVSLGWSYLKLKDYPSAQKAFDEALEFAKTKNILSDDIFLGQASLFSELNNPKKALEAYTQLIEQFPQSERLPESLLGQANSYYQLEDFSNAIKSYQMIIAKYAPSVESGGLLLDKNANKEIISKFPNIAVRYASILLG